MKICKICGKELNDNDRFCENCGSYNSEEFDDKIKKEKSKKLIVISIVLAMFILIGVIFYISKDKILYSYYIKKGDESNSPEIAINYYVDGLKIEYTNELVSRISDKILNDENFEDTLKKLEGNVNDEDLEKMYVKVYIKKAEESFDDENYKTTRKYLRKAENYKYDVEEFKYYEELLDKESGEVEDKKEVYIYNDYYSYNDMPMSNYYIIPDSNTRCLSASELYGYTSEELSYIRNEIYARHGYVFKKEKYRNYFSSMPWYVPNNNLSSSASYLNSVEKYNVELIKSLE